MIKMSGIYKITNAVTCDFYVGSAVNISNRFEHHRNALTANHHENEHLQRSWNKYGAACFEFSVCECCEKERLIEREQYYIDNEKPSYNICQIAGSRLGCKHTEESKRKNRESQTGVLGHNFGKHPSEESSRKNSEAHKGELNAYFGKRHTEETLAKMSAAKKGKLHPMFGKHHSDETLAKMSEIKKGKRHTDETRAKMSVARQRYLETKEVHL